MPIIGATQIQPVNFLESYARGRQLGEAERALQQQEVDRIRGVEQQRLLNQLYSQSMTPTGALDMNALGRQMITAGMGAQVPALQAQQAEVAQKIASARKTEAEVRPTEWKQFRDELATINPGDQARYQAWANRVLARAPWTIDLLQPVLTQETKNQMLMTADAALPKGEVRQIGGGTATIDPYTGKQIGATILNVEDAEKKAQRNIDLRNLSLREKELNLRREQFEREGDLEFQGRVEQMKAASKFKGEALAKAESDLPRAVDQAEATLSLIDRMVGTRPVRDASGKVKTPGGKPHPGFTDAVGATWKPGARLVPGTDAASFQAMYDQATGTAFLQAYETLRGSGQIANEEGKKATAAITRMNLAQNEKEFTEAAREFQSAIEAGVRRAREKVNNAAPTPKLSVEDQEALNWANANSSDPRAAEIKARLGVQ
jgi:hypothetical protein